MLRRTRFRLATGVLLGAWALASNTSATVLPSCGSGQQRTVPAGGWVPLAYDYEGIVVTAGGQVVAGAVVEVEGHRFWRPESPVAPGTRLLFDYTGCGFGSVEGPFAVAVEGRLPQLAIELVPGLAVELDPWHPTRTTPCGQDPRVLEQAGYCDCSDCGCRPVPEVALVSTELPEVWNARINLVDTTDLSASGQLLARGTQWFGEPVSRGWGGLSEGWGPVNAPVIGEVPLCTTVEFLLVPTGERSEVTRCIDPPSLRLTAQPIAPRFPYSIESCTLPPEGMLTEWCEQYRVSCFDAASLDRTRTLCTHVYELCDAGPPPQNGSGAVFGGSPLPDGGGSGGWGGTGSGGAPAQKRCSDDESTPPFHCALRPVPRGAPPAETGLLLGAILVGMARRGWRPMGTAR